MTVYLIKKKDEIPGGPRVCVCVRVGGGAGVRGWGRHSEFIKTPPTINT